MRRPVRLAAVVAAAALGACGARAASPAAPPEPAEVVAPEAAWPDAAPTRPARQAR